MAILFPNSSAVHRHQAGFDLYGQPYWSSPKIISVGVVTLSRGTQKTSVRADSSASRGRADEDVADGVVMVEPNVVIGLSDFLTVEGVEYEVISVFPRRDVMGHHRHTEVALRLLTGGPA